MTLLILNVTKNQGFTVSLKITFLRKPQGGKSFLGLSSCSSMFDMILTSFSSLIVFFYPIFKIYLGGGGGVGWGGGLRTMAVLNQ